MVDCDVCVVGGGPAGASLALRLASLGRRVIIVDRAVARIRAVESLGPLDQLLDVLGVRGSVEAERFAEVSAAVVDWGGERRRHPRRGMLVDRARFDAVLLARVSAHPLVRLIRPGRVVAATRIAENWVVETQAGETFRAAYLAETTGRTSLLDRRRYRTGPSTFALSARWCGAEGCDVGATLVEAGRDAWYWAAPLPHSELEITVFTDAAGVRAGHDALVQGSALIGAHLVAARRCSDVHVCDATSFAAEHPITTISIKVGDAALSIDPLSSQGVQTAIGTALHAAVVLNTFIERPTDAALATEHYLARVRESVAFHADAAAALYRQHAAVADSPFWRARGGCADAPRLHTTITPLTRIQLAPGVQFATVPVTTDRHVVRQDGVVCAGKTYAFVGPGIALAPLLRQLDAPTTGIEVVRRWSQIVRPAQALALLVWAGEHGLVAQLAEG